MSTNPTGRSLAVTAFYCRAMFPRDTAHQLERLRPPNVTRRAGNDRAPGRAAALSTSKLVLLEGVSVGLSRLPCHCRFTVDRLPDLPWRGPRSRILRSWDLWPSQRVDVASWAEEALPRRAACAAAVRYQVSGKRWRQPGFCHVRQLPAGQRGRAHVFTGTFARGELRTPQGELLPK